MLMMVLPMIWLYILRKRLDVDGIDAKSFEMNNLKTNGISKENGAHASNGLIKDKAVIINESTSNGENVTFLSNGK